MTKQKQFFPSNRFLFYAFIVIYDKKSQINQIFTINKTIFLTHIQWKLILNFKTEKSVKLFFLKNSNLFLSIQLNSCLSYDLFVIY